MDENEANAESYKNYLKKDIMVDFGVLLLIGISIIISGRLYPLWIVFLLGTKTFYEFKNSGDND
jgi:hypothetical protein